MSQVFVDDFEEEETQIDSLKNYARKLENALEEAQLRMDDLLKQRIHTKPKVSSGGGEAQEQLAQAFQKLQDIELELKNYVQAYQMSQKEVDRLRTALDQMADYKEDSMDEELRALETPDGFDTQEFMDDLLLFFKNLRRRVNVVVFGAFGSGKSALLSTMLTALRNQKRILKGIAPNRSDSHHVTTCLRKFEAGMVNLLDCWGFSDENFAHSQVHHILDGALSDGNSMHDAVQRKPKKSLAGAAASNDRECEEVNAVIIVVDAVDFVDNESLIARLNSLIGLLLDRDLVPMIALNKVDKLQLGVKNNLGQVFRYASVRSRILKISQETGLPVNQVFPVKSYECEYSRKLDIEKLALFCLRETIEANVNCDAVEGETETFESVC
eukprot:TRINITY_DN6907_c0_g1_i1.p1 TRINITY_DN6907_c0_g1~~TRINITY_DN6907_c0_g1_i1.p1  ORF type:complete len:384 (-),score=96.63 TRINITY_DN6907_c0_g1_i1:134-1285(-)